ncbi:MAG: hypothetical protein LBT60_07140 [Oscillospiraceae bacterium]|jgi:hypothetical protein|nr:hypothetical protein [Oscillospiraceae bacterium]
MKKRGFALAVCVLWVLSGCQLTPPVNPAVRNGNGTPSVNLPDTVSTAPPSETPPAAVPETLSPPESSAPAETGDVVEIKEKMFIAQTNDIYFNAEDYLGRTIKFEGIFDLYVAPDTGVTYCSVYRFGPGCCGIDANAGFEVSWDGAYPDTYEWVEAVGVLEEYKEDGYQYLRLALTSLNVLPIRGAETVSQ